MLSVKQGGISVIFWVFRITSSGSPRPLANTLTILPYANIYIYIYIYICKSNSIRWILSEELATGSTVRVANFLKDINNDGSFHIRQDSQHDLYWLLHWWKKKEIKPVSMHINQQIFDKTQDCASASPTILSRPSFILLFLIFLN